MGRRSNFERIPKDKYPTIDPRAVPPLLPHLAPGARYAEPCAGEGHLIRQLAPHVQAEWWDTLQENGDGDALHAEIGQADLWITNPPWTRKVLHPLIVHLSDQAPAWLLFDSNWANTQQAKPFMARCRKIVVVGRLIWIEGTTMAGKEDVSWYLFDKPRQGNVPSFYGYQCLPDTAKRTHRVCHDCGVLIDRFGKWHLQTRNGVASPVHRDCAHPSGPPPADHATPLLDWMPS